MSLIPSSLISNSSPHHFQGHLRGPEAHSVAVTGKAEFPHLRSTLICDGDENQSHRLLRGAARGTGNARDAESDGRTGAGAHACRQSLGDGLGNRSVLLNQLGRYGSPSRFHLVGVANRTTEEITRTAGDARQ